MPAPAPLRRALVLLAVAALMVSGPARGEEHAPPEAAPPSADEVPAVFEEVEVTGARGGDKRAPVGVASSVVNPDDAATPPASLTEMVVEVPGVAENGQGGLFQVVSIRGISRHRVQSQVAGMRITSERRAGVSTSFLDPLLVESADVLRGPASSYYGSGALGGVLQVFPRRFTAPFVSAGYESEGDENVIVAGSRLGERWSMGFARRDASNADDAAGNELNSGFTQYSAVVRGAWGDGPRFYSLTYVPSYAEDIGKPNSDFPTRTTVYPKERHHLLSFSIHGREGWSFDAAVHPQDLETDVLEAGVARSNVKNESFDFSSRFEKELRLGGRDRTGPGDAVGPGVTARLGADLFGRRGVDSDETRMILDPNNPAPTQSFSALDDGESTEAGLFATLSGAWGRATWETGARFIHVEQDNAGFSSESESAASGFMGLAVPVTDHLSLEGHAGTGLRVPSLAERFFTGTTGRGQVTGNPDLDSERSLNTDLGLRWLTGEWLITGSIFRNEIDDYIERVEVSPGQLTFVNLTDGTIEGAELQAAWQPADAWRLSFGGHLLDGEDDDGNDLADIPQDEVFAGVRWRRGRVTTSGRWAWRNDKNDPGSGEMSIESANIVSASVAVQIEPDWRVAVTATNLLDEEYFPSADDKASLAVGRSLGVWLTWAPAE